jgi:hypothetical protein
VIDSFFTNAAPFMTFFAPGNSILTSWLDQMFTELFPLFGLGSGTSLAAPHVAGAWAILKQAMPGASVDDLVAALQATGTPVTDTRPGGTVTKPLVRVEAALDRLLGPSGPLITKLTPDNAVAGAGDFTLAVDGANFAVGSIVLVNGVQRPTTVVSDSRVSAAVPASDIAASGSASVSVRNPDGRASNATALPIAAGPCLVGEYFAEYFSNNTLSGPATRTACERPATEWEPFIRASWGMAAPEGVPVDNFSVRWTGRFPFGESTDYLFRTRIAEVANEIRVYVDGVLIADDVRARSGFQTVTRSMTAGLHEVRIEYLERGGGAGVLVEWFHLTAAQPAVTNLVPAIATAGDASFTLTAEGTGFQPGATLYWNGSARPTAVTSATQLSASISAVDIARAGTAWITIRNADGQRTFGQVFRIADPAATAPTLSALTPDTAMEDGPDFTMVVTGTDFVPGVTVVWGNAPIPTTFESATRLTARVSGATELHNTIGEVWVTVRNPDGQTSNVIKFVVVGKPRPTPTLTALTPSTAAAGGPAFTLTLDGTGLDGVGVYWNGVFRPTRAVSSTRVTADIPASDIAVAGTFPVDVRPISGVDSNRLNFTVTGGPQTVTISALTPSTVVEGGPAFTLTIDGGNFVSGAVVLWNGAPRPTTFISANRLTADLSAADVAAAGSFVVTVRNPDLRVSNAVPLTVTAAPTLLVSFTSPDEGVTVSGSVLVRVEETGAVYTPIAFTVTLDGNFMAGVSGSATSLGVFWDTWKYPNGAHTLAVTVRDNAGRTATATRHVTVAGSTAPIATALTPASAPAGGPAFTLTVDGTGFVSGGVVTWNGSVRTTTFVSATRVTASITAADIAAPGSASVMVWNPDFGRSRPLTFTIGSAAPAPTLSSLTPGDATAGGPAFALDVDGRNFVSGATVLWNGAARPTTFVSATRVTASIAAADIAAPGSAQVSVRNPDLQTSNTQSFSIAAPELQALFTSPAQGASVSGTVSVGMSATGTSGTPISFTLTVDGGQVFTTSGTATTASLDWNTAGYAAGAHTLGLTVRDGAGRTATATRNVTVTGGTLRVAITQPGADGATVSGTTWFVLWVEGAAAGTKTYTLSVGGVNVATTNDASSGPISMGWDTRQVVDGTTTVIATARDAAGNTGSAPRIVTVSNGPQPLVASFTSPGEGAAVSGAVSVAMSESGGTGTITWTLRLDGGATPIFTTSGAATTASFSWDTSAVAPGAHRLDLTVQDGGGRTASATRNVTVASPAPLTASFTSPAEGATVSAPVTVGMSESGGTGTITWTVRLDGGATPIFTTSGSASTASFTWDSSTVAPGAHRLDLTVQDGAGRTATATRAVTAQAAGSIRVFITQPAEGATIDAATTATVWFTIWIENAAAGSKTYTLSIDGAVVGTSSTTSTGPVSMPWTVGGTSNGPHAATISVRDAAGNSGSANRALTVTNASGPAPLVASFMSPAEGANVNGVVTIGMSETGADGTPITFTLTVDGAQVFTTSGTAATASFGWNADSVAAAQHTLGLTVRDGAGRTATATRHVTVTDVPPPPLTASFTSPAEGATVSGAVAVGLSETGGTGTLTWRVAVAVWFDESVIVATNVCVAPMSAYVGVHVNS